MLEETSRNKDRETGEDKQNICRKGSIQLELETNPGKQRPVHKATTILYGKKSNILCLTLLLRVGQEEL